MILDASALYAYFVRAAPDHWAVYSELDLIGPREELIISPLSIPELETMVLPRFGRVGWSAVLEQLCGGAWAIARVDADHLGALIPLVEEGMRTAVASVLVLGQDDSILSFHPEHRARSLLGNTGE